MTYYKKIGIIKEQELQDLGNETIGNRMLISFSHKIEKIKKKGVTPLIYNISQNLCLSFHCKFATNHPIIKLLLQIALNIFFYI